MILNDEAPRRSRERTLKRVERPGWPIRRTSKESEQRQPEETAT